VLALLRGGANVSKGSKGWKVETTTATVCGDSAVCDTGAAGYYTDLESIVLEEAAALYWLEPKE
jgi:hypothetical protein